MAEESPFYPPTPGARTFTARRKVRLGDSGIGGQLRLDALARYFQDVANDDTASAGVPDEPWVLRRCTVEVRGRPRWNEEVTLTTWSGGLGSRWAERRTRVVHDHGTIESAALWVYVDTQGRPAKLSQQIIDLYGPSAAGRVPSHKFTIPPPPAPEPGSRDSLDSTDGTGDSRAMGVEWPVRVTDFDVFGHVNNAVYWTMVEAEPLEQARYLLEFRQPVEPGRRVRHLSDLTDPTAGRHWLVSEAGVHAAAHVTAHRG